jgi:hypothetical protein
MKRIDDLPRGGVALLLTGTALVAHHVELPSVT